MGSVVIQQPYSDCWVVVAHLGGWCWLMGSNSLQASGTPSSLGQAVEPRADTCCHALTGHTSEQAMIIIETNGADLMDCWMFQSHMDELRDNERPDAAAT